MSRAVSMKLMANHPLRLVRLAEVYVNAGRSENALPLAAEALDLSQEQRERGHEAYARRLLGEVWSTRDAPDFDRAEEYYRKSLDLAEHLGMRPLQGHCHLGLGRLLLRTGRPEPARTALAAARVLLEEMEMRSWLRRVDSATESG